MSTPVSYRTGVNRAVTRKWAEAKAINYDDWDDEDDYDEPVQPGPGHGSQPSWGASSQAHANPQQQYYPSNRSVTNPSPTRSTGRTSFDRGDERRHFSSNVGGFEGPYPTAQRAPFPEPQHHAQPLYDHQMRGQRAQPSLHLQTQSGRPPLEHAQYPQGPFTADPSGHQYSEPRGGPLSAPVGPPGRRSHSSGRPALGEIFPQLENQMRPNSQDSTGGSPSRAFPPRKSSLSQQQPPPDIGPLASCETPAVAEEPSASNEVKPLPFIRPADIYRRVEEEREKQRRSQESSRPSFESATSRIRESSAASRAGSDGPERPSETRPGTEIGEDMETSRRMRPTLDPVAERKSEYGFDNMLKEGAPDHPSIVLARTDSLSMVSDPTSATSEYTNRPDPVSASSVSRQSPLDQMSEIHAAPSLATSPPSAPFSLPAIREVSDFGNDMFSQPADPNKQPLSSPGSNATRLPLETTTAQSSTAADENLHHQKSLGYRSMVEQAFEGEQNQVPPTPVSITDTVARSNSAGTSDVSPIINRGYAPNQTQTVIREQSGSRPTSAATEKQLLSGSAEKDLPPPPAIKAGFHRNSQPPSPSNSPAKRPISVAVSDTPQGELAEVATVTPSTARPAVASGYGSTDALSPAPGLVADGDYGTDKASPPDSMMKQLEKPPLLPRTTSEDWREWQSQRRQFNSKMGIQDSNPTTPATPALTSPISRAESPSKGTVRDIADKLENRSGRSSPAAAEASRPSNARLESFRPSLPGGWQSYSTNADVAQPQQEMKVSTPHNAETEDEDIPTAGPPRHYPAGPSKTAFAAAAAAGTALAGAFSGFSQPAGKLIQDDSHEASEDTSRTSTSRSHSQNRTPQGVSGAGENVQENEFENQFSSPSPLPPTPLPKDTPSEADAGQSTLDYFPAPLKTSRTNEQLKSARPTAHTALSTETSPMDDENDRLRKEIVKSLTPKSSRRGDDPTAISSQGAFPVSTGSQRTTSTQDDNVLPQEYDSYWRESGDTGSHSEDHVPTGPVIHDISEQRETDVTDIDLPKNTTLEHRFSWEIGGGQTPPATVPPRIGEPDSPETSRAPIPSELLSSSEALRPAPSVKISESKTLLQVNETRDPVSPAGATVTPPANGSFKERPFRDILALGTPGERIQAYNTHRQYLANAGDGGLGNWLQNIGRGSPEHAALLSANGQLLPAEREAIQAHRPSPARPKFRIASDTFSSRSETSGTKQMQEDGKRLLHVAGKFGGKAGVTAKGLLAKGKDRFRTVSSGDKGTFQNRRRSSQLPITPEEPTQHSSYPSAPPQIPPQNLDISPVEDDAWSLPYAPSKQDPKIPFNERAANPITNVTGDSTVNSLSPPITTEDAKPTSTRSTGNAGFIDHIIADRDEVGQGRDVARLAPSTNDVSPSIKHVNNHSHSTDLENSRNVTDSLAAPTDRRSMVSNISSPSPGPVSSGDEARSRSISPPRAINERSENEVPIYSSALPSSKSAEAEAEQQRAQREDDKIGGELLPTYEIPVVKSPIQASALGPNAQIVPVADLSARKREENKPLQARPFSFADSNSWIEPRVQGQTDPNHPATPTQEPMPLSESLRKEDSNVSVKEVHDEINPDAAKSRTSYSRPFGANTEPNVQDHPAFRNAVDRSQMYSTESPLPSARRQQGSPLPRQEHQGPNQGEEGYRIPGPYGQEYRSPKPTLSPSSASQGPESQLKGTQIPNPRFVDGGNVPVHDPPRPSTNVQREGGMGPPPLREADKSRQRTFGSFFRTRSKSRSRRSPQNELSRPEDSVLTKKTEKRNSLFRKNSRQESVSSQGSRLGSLRQTPSREQAYRRDSSDPLHGGSRRRSKDILGNTGSAEGIDEDAGKKRFSLTGGLFGKTGFGKNKSNIQDHSPQQPRHQPYDRSPQRASTLQSSVTGRPTGTSLFHHQQTHPRSGFSQPQAQAPANARGNTAPLNRMYGQTEEQRPASAFPHGPDSFVDGLPPAVGARPQPHGYIAAQSAKGVSEPYQPSPPQEERQFDSRPSDLRNNTTQSTAARQAYTPSTAPPVPAPNSNPSYRHQFPTTRAPDSVTSAPAHSRAVDLHKRSRSPKLGRRASSEDLTQRYANDPASQLGTFSSKSRSPHTADREDVEQEKPWRIDLPSDEGRRNETTGGSRVAQPLQRSDSAANRRMVAELPGSKADGYESEEEIPMSATAYPGQEWMPSAVDLGYGRWDD